MTAILEKDALASQPTLSRFFNRMDEDTLAQFSLIYETLENIFRLYAYGTRFYKWV